MVSGFSICLRGTNPGLGTAEERERRLRLWPQQTPKAQGGSARDTLPEGESKGGRGTVASRGGLVTSTHGLRDPLLTSEWVKQMHIRISTLTATDQGHHHRHTGIALFKKQKPNEDERVPTPCTTVTCFSQPSVPIFLSRLLPADESPRQEC